MSQDMSLANVVESVSDKCSPEIIKKFQWAIKRVANEHGTNGKEMALTQDELVELIQAWEPKRDIICLYVRWARQLRRNFNLDSIATLLCLSRQCEYTPVDFVRQVKTLSVHKNHGKSAYGVTFHFEIPNRKDIDRERLNKEFLGLSVTLALLQEQITDSPSILGKTRMRECGPRTAFPIAIPVDEKKSNQNKNVAVISHPNIEFHTQQSLLSRIWISINHRWLTLYLTEHLFREPNLSWSYTDALVYSFQMMAPCGPGRFEFLSPLAGYCLRFRTQESIDSKRSQLRTIWKDPSSFMSFGNTCLTQFSEDAKARIIIACFQDLRSGIPHTSRQISYNKDSSWVRRWTILRAYIFHYWLDAASNASLKSTVTSNTCYGKKKRKVNDSDGTAPAAILVDRYALALTATQPPHPMIPTAQKQRYGGLQSIISSRRTSDPTIDSTTEKHLPDGAVDGKLGKPNDQSSFTVNPNDHCQTSSTLRDLESFRLITLEEFQRLVQSYLLVHRHDGVDILAELSPLEVYSADHLHDLVHCRLSGCSPFYPTGHVGPIVLHIRPEADCFIDKFAKSFHVAREHSEYFQEYAHLLPSMQQIKVLCREIVYHGTIDTKRAIGQHRVNIGNGGQNWVDGAPCKLHGLQFKKDLVKAGTSDAREVLQTIGQLAEFTWQVMCSFQGDASDHPIAPDTFRKQLYASQLNQYLHMNGDIGFEDLTLVVSSLHPTIHEVSKHKDTMNDTVAGYTRTAAFNMVMINDDEPTPSIIHFQVICNFRKVIGKYVIPFHNYLSPVAKHAREYFDRWHRSINAIYAGKTQKVPTLYDRWSYFLDDNLEYSVVSISEEGKHKQSIASEYILTEINVSRTLSLSMFIDPLVKLQRYIKFDQTIELALACSFLSNPFWFDWSMSTLLQRLDNPEDLYEIALHPFYDWACITDEIFGGWQGGPYNRWSPCGGNKETVLETFGAQRNATKEERQQGERKLSQVVSILWEHVVWINSLTSCGENPILDMALPTLKARNERTIKEIARIASCQFSHFRLCILTTILSGCGLLKEGRHLRNLVYPVKGSASFKHLCCPVADFMSPQRARALGTNKEYESVANDGEGIVEEEQHDLFMQYLSAELGFQVYVRDEIECILCESHPLRTLNCRDWFRKGMSLYNCNEKGEFFRRAYGRNTEWIKLSPPERYDFAYVETTPIQYIPLDGTLSRYAEYFGNQLRSKDVQFKGRKSKTSSQQQSFSNSYHTKNEPFGHLSIQVADFYQRSKARTKNMRSMFVLGDAEHAVEMSLCNNIERYPMGKVILNYLQTLPISNSWCSTEIAAGCYHKDSEMNTDQVTFFPGHLDKAFVHTAWFVPLGRIPFFTVIAVAKWYNLKQDVDSIRHFNEWSGKLSTGESRKVSEFLIDFDVQAKKHMRQESLVRLIYLNICGSVLSFPANQCYHATITPTRPPGFPRDMFIFHPLDGIA